MTVGPKLLSIINLCAGQCPKIQRFIASKINFTPRGLEPRVHSFLGAKTLRLQHVPYSVLCDVLRTWHLPY